MLWIMVPPCCHRNFWSLMNFLVVSHSWSPALWNCQPRGPSFSSTTLYWVMTSPASLSATCWAPTLSQSVPLCVSGAANRSSRPSCLSNPVYKWESNPFKICFRLAVCHNVLLSVLPRSTCAVGITRLAAQMFLSQLCLLPLWTWTTRQQM